WLTHLGTGGRVHPISYKKTVPPFSLGAGITPLCGSWALPGEWRRRRLGKVQLTLVCTANPASAARWFLSFPRTGSCHSRELVPVIPAKAGIYGGKGLDPRLRGDDDAGDGDDD